VPNHTNNIRPVGTTIPPVTNPTLIPTYVTTTTLEDALQRNRIPLNTNNNIINTLFGGLFGDLMELPVMGAGGLDSFLNQRVQVHPTPEQIENASNVYTATQNLDDICAICQDTLETNQRVRRLLHCNHSFHLDCIDTWFRTNVHCPTCRHDIREVTENQNNPPPVPDNHRRTNIRG